MQRVEIKALFPTHFIDARHLLVQEWRLGDSCTEERSEGPAGRFIALKSSVRNTECHKERSYP
jgi:hypothetical protein